MAVAAMQNVAAARSALSSRRCLPVRRDSAVTRLSIHSSRRDGATDQHFVVIVLQWNAVIDAAMANRREIKHRGG